MIQRLQSLMELVLSISLMETMIGICYTLVTKNLPKKHSSDSSLGLTIFLLLAKLSLISLKHAL